MKQTFILKAEKNGKTINFERFTCKRLQTVTDQFWRAFEKWADTFLMDEYINADIIRIYATDGDGSNEKKVAEYTPEAFYSLKGIKFPTNRVKIV